MPREQTDNATPPTSATNWTRYIGVPSIRRTNRRRKRDTRTCQSKPTQPRQYTAPPYWRDREQKDKQPEKKGETDDTKWCRPDMQTKPTRGPRYTGVIGNKRASSPSLGKKPTDDTQRRPQICKPAPPFPSHQMATLYWRDQKQKPIVYMVALAPMSATPLKARPNPMNLIIAKSESTSK